MTAQSTTSPDEITAWTGPPAHSLAHRYRDYTEVVRQLREHPGQWARLGDRSSPSAAYQFAVGVRRGRPVAFVPVGDFEGASQGKEVYVRYVGEDQASSHEVAEFVDGHVEADAHAMPAETRTRLAAKRNARTTEALDTTHLFSL